jgi:hypothetical protein
VLGLTLSPSRTSCTGDRSAHESTKGGTPSAVGANEHGKGPLPATKCHLANRSGLLVETWSPLRQLTRHVAAAQGESDQADTDPRF